MCTISTYRKLQAFQGAKNSHEKTGSIPRQGITKLQVTERESNKGLGCCWCGKKENVLWKIRAGKRAKELELSKEAL